MVRVLCVVGSGQGLEIVDSAIHSDGAYAADLRLVFNGAIAMNGYSVIMQATRKMPAAIEEVLERGKVPAASVVQFLMHRANQNLIDRVAKSVRVPSDRFYTNIRRYGNTSSASHADRSRRMGRDRAILNPATTSASPPSEPDTTVGAFARAPILKCTRAFRRVSATPPQ